MYSFVYTYTRIYTQYKYICNSSMYRHRRYVQFVQYQCTMSSISYDASRKLLKWNEVSANYTGVC